jgi:hypothetical protein
VVLDVVPSTNALQDLLAIVHSACAGLHRFWDGTLSKHGTVIGAIEETLTSAAPDSVLDGVLPQLLTINAVVVTQEAGGRRKLAVGRKEGDPVSALRRATQLINTVAARIKKERSA